MQKKNIPALTPTRRDAHLRAVRMRRRVLFGVVFLVAAFLAIAFVRNGYTLMNLKRTRETERQENASLLQKKKTYREKIKNSSSLEGQKDQMRKTGRFENDEVPFVILEPDKQTPRDAAR